MKKLGLFSVLLLVACANDPQSGSVVGGAVGGATGAGVGYGVGGRDGAILGGAIGGAVGAAVGQNQAGSARQASVRQPVAQPRYNRNEEYRSDREGDDEHRHTRKKHERDDGDYRDHGERD